MRLGVFGGTFDPIHLGHLLMAEAALEALRLDRLDFVPVGDPWQKRHRPVSPAADRLALLEAALGGDPRFGIDRREVERPGPSYSVDTLRAIAAELPGSELFLLLGADAAAGLASWHEADQITELARVAVVARPGVTPAALPAGGVWLPAPRVDVSASEIRRRVAAGLSIRWRVPDAVAQLIATRGLYRAPGA